jgi:hypothetical protein
MRCALFLARSAPLGSRAAYDMGLNRQFFRLKQAPANPFSTAGIAGKIAS